MMIIIYLRNEKMRTHVTHDTEMRILKSVFLRRHGGFCTGLRRAKAGDLLEHDDEVGSFPCQISTDCHIAYIRSPIVVCKAAGGKLRHSSPSGRC
jgi:hypothetical protein